LQFRLKKVEHENDSFSLLKSGLWTALQMPPSLGNLQGSKALISASGKLVKTYEIKSKNQLFPGWSKVGGRL
jgi:hypothetical protein